MAVTEPPGIPWPAAPFSARMNRVAPRGRSGSPPARQTAGSAGTPSRALQRMGDAFE